MKLKEDEDRFDDLQMILIGGIVDAIKDELDKAGLPAAKSRELLEALAFSVAAILDGSRAVEHEGERASPVITFQGGENELVYPGGSSWMHEYVFGVVGELYED